ncbi:MAG: AAA family ATPase, partial [Deltaproteobacteria bacterium]|nr:AAA family ATPase [Deltaproteobacteria bacterium]
LGALLRSRASQRQEKVLLFIDQFEELYTLVPDPQERAAYTACLVGVADDPSTPLRVVLSMRSDFLDRALEDRRFMDRLTRGLAFLPPMGRDAMRDALTQPLDMVGYRFEDPSIVEHMLDQLSGTSGALPLMQFTAAKLWETRDQRQQVLRAADYQALGGVGGALATHADDVLNRMPPAQQGLTRSVFQRLVTDDGTRAIVEVGDLAGLSSDPSQIHQLIDYLVGARLLSVHTREGAGPAVEIVHESLLASWPTLRRWLDETGEDAAFLGQLRAAAKQWDGRGRPAGLLWRGEAADEAKRFRRRHRGTLSKLESDYLQAVLSLAGRAARRKRGLVIAAFVVLLGLIAAAAVALISIREAEQNAQQERQVAEREAARAKAAEVRVSEQLETIQDQLETIDDSKQQIDKGKDQLAMTNQELRKALNQATQAAEQAQEAREKAERASREARKAAESEREAKQRVEKLLAVERKRVKALELEKKKLTTKLK